MLKVVSSLKVAYFRMLTQKRMLLSFAIIYRTIRGANYYVCNEKPLTMA